MEPLKLFIAFFSICLIAGLEFYAISKGLNGRVFRIAVGAIAAIAGWVVGVSLGG